MTPLTTAHVRGLLTPSAAPCVSLYLPTHRRHPDNQQDPIRYRNLVDTVERSLRAGANGRAARGLVERLRALDGDRSFWNHTLDGLAVLAAGDRFDVFRVPRSLPVRAVVADSFHVKPLLRVVQSADRFQVLGVSRTETFLYEGNRYGLDRVDTAGLVPTFAEAVGEDERTEPHLSRLTTGGRTPGTGHYSGQGSRKDELDVDTERFFREVDRAVTTAVSEQSRLPLVLVALSQHQTPFREQSHNRYLLPDGVAADPGALAADGLLAEVWKVVEPRYLERLARLTESYGTAAARGLAAHQVADIARAGRDGRIGVLLVDADRTLPGHVDATTGEVRFTTPDDPSADDLFDDLAELALKTGADVVVVPSDRMPTDTGLAAIFRF